MKLTKLINYDVYGALSFEIGAYGLELVSGADIGVVLALKCFKIIKIEQYQTIPTGAYNLKSSVVILIKTI